MGEKQMYTKFAPGNLRGRERLGNQREARECRYASTSANFTLPGFYVAFEAV
jgi:hypothetical protein